MNLLTSLFFLLIAPAFAGVMPLSDNVLFAFEKCKELSVDLEKGQLKETRSSSFDLHCRKNKDNAQELICSYFDAGSNKKLREEIFRGGSNLGEAQLKNDEGGEIKFLIGKQYASFISGKDPKACAGIFLFEKEALKQKQ